MFYLWDSVFSKDKRPLEIKLDQKLITYADFANLSFEFIDKLAPQKNESLSDEYDLDDLEEEE